MKPVRNVECGVRSEKRGGSEAPVTIPGFSAFDKLSKHYPWLHAVICMPSPRGVIPHSALRNPHYIKEVL
jgi:hypothetical protein